MQKLYRNLLALFSLILVPVLLWAEDTAAPAAADATAAKPPVNPFFMQLPMIIMVMALVYFVMLAPQRKQQKQLQDFQKSLAKGDEIVTASGIIGTIAGLTEKVVTLEVSPGTEIRILRTQVQGRLKELKTLEVQA